MSADQLGPDSAAALDGQVLLGIALRSAGLPEEADAQFQEALGLLNARFGDSGSATLAGRLSYAVNLWSLDHFAAAEDEIRLVLAAYESSWNPRKPLSRSAPRLMDSSGCSALSIRIRSQPRWWTGFCSLIEKTSTRRQRWRHEPSVR
jgi:hypothetical protein